MYLHVPFLYFSAGITSLKTIDDVPSEVAIPGEPVTQPGDPNLSKSEFIIITADTNKYRCTLCNMNMSDVDPHLKGVAHQRKVSMYRENGDNGLEVGATGVEPDSTDKQMEGQSLAATNR